MTTISEATAAELVAAVRRIHDRIRDGVVAACERDGVDAASRVVAEEQGGDTIFAIDRVSEDLLVELVEAEIAGRAPVVLVAEGLEGGSMVLPRGAAAAQARWRIIVDPIDGTRGLMYQKRAAWILTGIAPERGAATSLRDIEIAVMTEIPLIKQHRSDQLWAVRGAGAQIERYDRIAGSRHPLAPSPTRARDLRHGFAMISRFFPGARDQLAAIDEELMRRCIGPIEAGRALCFEDQYISSGGQFAELIMGHDRFNADLRPLLAGDASRGLVCHPYDVCTALIAEECGVAIRAPGGGVLDAPLDVEHPVAWVGYGNAAIRALVEPELHAILDERGLLPVMGEGRS